MAVDLTNVPPWKQAILERKKRHEEDEKGKKTEELSRFSQMPSWKRDILLKKQQQKQAVNGKVHVDSVDQCNNVNDERTALGAVTINVNHTDGMPEKKLSPLCPTAEFDYGVLSKEEESQEHLLPIHQNFWLKSDPKKASSHLPKLNLNHVQEASPSGPNSNSGVNSLNSSGEFESPAIQPSAKPDEDDDVFSNGEEMQYGRGFVNKLLKKFTHLSSPGIDDRNFNSLPRKSPSPFSKRNHSADTLLDSPRKSNNRNSWAPGITGYSTLDRYDCLQSSPGFSSKDRARSMDNLLSPSAEDSAKFSVQPETDTLLISSVSMDNLKNTANERPASPVKETEEEEMPKPNIVSLTRNVFENISQVVPDSLSPRSKTVEPSLDSSRGSSSNLVPKPAQDSAKTTINGGGSYVNGIDKPSSPRSTTTSEPLGTSRYFSSKKSSAPPPPKPSIEPTVSQPKADVNANQPIVDNIQSNWGVHIRTNIPSEPVCTNDVVSEPTLNQNNNTVFANDSDKTDSSAPVWNKPKARVVPDSKPLDKEVKKPLNVTTVQVTADLSTEDSPPPIAPPRTNSRPAALAVQPPPPVKEVKKPDPQRPKLNLNELQPKKTVVERKENNFHKQRQSNSVVRENKKNKRPDSAGPGSLLIRPASNLVIGSTKTEYLQLTKYNDIKTGEFAPAKRKPGYYDTYSDDEDDYEEVPVTNIDDFLGNGDMPVTNIDDLAHDEGYVPREGDASHHRHAKVAKKWDFEGAGVCVGKSSLSRKTGQRMVSAPDSCIHVRR
jgi:hypothetical protein